MSASLSTYCCTVTCFDTGGQIDDSAMRAHFARIAEAGVGLYVGSPSPGEGATLTPAELAHLLALAKTAAGGRVPVRAMGVGPRHTGEMTAFRAEGRGESGRIYAAAVASGGGDAAPIFSAWRAG